MSFYLNLFSVETWKAFKKHGSSISGFSKHQRTQASKIPAGSIMLCYVVGLSRWVGALKIDSEAFEDTTPVFSTVDDKFIIRFQVTPLVSLEIENAIPISTPEVWNKLQWTKNINFGAVGWGANFQRSLRQIPDEDGEYLLNILQAQDTAPKHYPLSLKEARQLESKQIVKTQSGTLPVEIPDEVDNDLILSPSIDRATTESLRESLKIQAILARVGSLMGLKVWLPRTDLTQLTEFLDSKTRDSILDELPLAFDDATIRTIENIDVLWLDSRTIVRAFEVEHTTAIYSGLLRMADLLALVPNLNLPLHIVAPSERKEKVFKEINRPVFQLMQTKLSECCSFIPYESVYELERIPKIQHMNHSIIEEYEEFRDY